MMALAADHTPPTRRRTANRLSCDVDRCSDYPGRAMAIFVRCIDNTLAADVLVVGEIYEVMHVNERDGRCPGSVGSPWPALRSFPLRRSATGHRGVGVRLPPSATFKALIRSKYAN